LTDTNDQILNKIKKAKTDGNLMPSEKIELKKRPEVENLLSIYSSLKNQNIEKSIDEFSGKNFSDFKDNLAETVVDKISPISKEIINLLKNEDYIDKILEEGAEKADAQATNKINEIKKIIGF